uniref:Sorbose reductase SOU1 n=1 Tax=Pyricularia oryzae (strain P131) TaxID=1143193 RepID=L7IWR2_PYRO1
MLSLSRTAPRLATRCRTTTTTRPLLATLATTQQPSKPRFSSSGATTSLPEFSLKDKVLVVSGGGRGLGLVQAEALLEAGAREVHAIDRLTSPGEDFARVADKFSAASGSGSALQYHRIDVRESEALNGAVEAIAERHGRIDGLVAAAGVQQATPALEYNQEDSDRMLGINVTGVFMTAQALGRNLASEWGQLGIRVNTISPGYIVTAMTEDLFKEHPEFRTNWTKENMLGRLSTPEEYRGAAVFLLSDASSFMTGSDLRIDGGHAAW